MAYDFPTAPINGQEFTPAGGPTYTFQTPVWLLKGQSTSGGLVISDTAPPAPIHGMQWWESDTGRMFIYYEDVDTAQWVHIPTLTGEQPLADVPLDGKQYGRENAAWTSVKGLIGGWELIEEGEYSNVTLWEHIDLAPYLNLQLNFFIRPVTDSVSAAVAFTRDNGATWDTGTNQYLVGLRYGSSQNAMSGFSWWYPYIFFNGATYIGNNAAVHCGMYHNLVINDFNKPIVSRFLGAGTWYQPNGGGSNTPLSQGFHNFSQPANGVRLYFSSGDISYLRVVLMGQRG